MANNFYQIKRQLRGRAKTLAVLLLMVFIPLFASLKEMLGFDSAEEFLEEIAVWVVRLVVLIAVLFFVRKILYLFNGSSRAQSRSKNQYPSKKVGFKGSGSLKPVIQYWYQSILDGKLAGISERELSEVKLSISQDTFFKGKLKPDELEGLRELAARKEILGAAVEILISPFRFRLKESRNHPSKDMITPCWIPAVLTLDGEIVPPKGNLCPWIPRQYLEPLTGDTLVSFGETKDLEKFSFPEDCKEAWKGYLKTSEKFFKHVTGDGFSDFSIEGFAKDEQIVVFLSSSGASGSQYIEARYSEILNYGGSLGLLTTLAKLGVTGKSPGKNNPLTGANLHLAQFQNRFPLSVTQRKAVHESLLLSKGSVIAVTGPPGTGKTTIIQSIIGSTWVDSAIRGRAYPPVTLCCSSSNQATTNILKSFSQHERWLPQLDSFGLFCSSKSKAEELTDTLFTVINGEGTLKKFETFQYLEQAKDFYLDRFSSTFFKTNDLRKATSHIKKELWKETENFKKELGKVLNGDSPLLGLENLDTTRRFNLLRLASHYWESRWLNEVSKIIQKLESAGRDRRNLYLTRLDWQIRSMLTPCLVSTFAMAPQYFGNTRASDNSKENPVDLLIADEAGQVSPEVGAATFSLASRAIVIGDVNQLEPVWSVLSITDQANLQKFKIIKSPESTKLLEIEKSGIMASSGNLMSVALNLSANWEFLSEQRRSVPKIVAFANELSYGGKLVAIREDPVERIVPAFGYVHVRGLSERVGKSLRNSVEAREIQSWLKANQEKISTFYNKSASESIAVITPFTAQARLLNQLLLEDYPGMIIGTIHSLQGAEREVIIFSPVYSSSGNTNYFFDQKPNMLNVAVTRAKDSFLVFGDTQIFNMDGNAPSNILAKYLFENPNNKLTSAQTSAAAVPTSSAVVRLDTLEQHREALVLAIRQATKEVLIVSPTISSVAIEYDKIDFEIIAAVQKGVRVLVYIDWDLNSENEVLRLNADLGIKMLVAAGAELYITDRIHNKSLVVDDNVLYEGSFNWLSAARKKDSKHQKMEVSFRHDGPGTKEQIRSLRYELNERKIRQVKFEVET